MLVDDDAGVARPVDTLAVPEAAELAFIVRVADVEAEGGLLPRALDGDPGYVVSFPAPVPDTFVKDEVDRGVFVGAERECGRGERGIGAQAAHAPADTGKVAAQSSSRADHRVHALAGAGRRST